MRDGLSAAARCVSIVPVFWCSGAQPGGSSKPYHRSMLDSLRLNEILSVFVSQLVRVRRVKSGGKLRFDRSCSVGLSRPDSREAVDG